MDSPQIPQHPQLDRLFEAGFLSIYAQDLTERKNLTKEQLDELWHHLTAPVVQVFLREMAHNMVRDMFRLDFTRTDDQLKLASKYAHARGALEVLDLILSSTQERK